MLDASVIHAQFTRLAKSYDANSWLQNRIADELIDRVEMVGVVGECLVDLGSATGYLGRSAKNKFPDKSVVEIDISLAMASESSKSNPSAKTLVSSAEMLALDNESVSLVIANMLLHWCDVSAVLSEVSRILKVGGSFFFSTLGPDSLLELRLAWAQADILPHVHDFVDMHDLGDALIKAGLAEPVLDTDRLCVTYDDYMNLIVDLRKMGAINARQDRRKTWTGKKRYQRAMDEYEVFRNQDRKLPVTWEVVYGLATKDRSWLGKPIPIVTVPGRR